MANYRAVSTRSVNSNADGNKIKDASSLVEVFSATKLEMSLSVVIKKTRMHPQITKSRNPIETLGCLAKAPPNTRFQFSFRFKSKGSEQVYDCLKQHGKIC